jgi:hypothetical protein
MKAYFSLWIVSFLLLGFSVFSDVVEPGMKSVDYCFQVENVSDFPDYVFVAYFQEPVGGHAVIGAGKCVSFYKFGNPKIYAIKKSDFNTNAIGKDRDQEKDYFTNNPKLIPSELTIRSVGNVKVSNPLEKVVDVIKIVSLSETKLVLIKSKVFYTYTNGTIEERPYLDQNQRPEPSKMAVLPLDGSQIWGLLLSILSLLSIGIIFIRRRLRK